MSMVGRTRSSGHVLLQGILKYAIRRTFLAVSIVQACNILSGKILKSPQPWVIKSKRDKSIRNDRNIDHCNLRLGQVLILGCIKINGTETLGNTKYYSHPEFHHTNRLSYHVNPESILKLAVWAKIYSKGVHFSKKFFFVHTTITLVFLTVHNFGKSLRNPGNCSGSQFPIWRICRDIYWILHSVQASFCPHFFLHSLSNVSQEVNLDIQW